MNTKSISTIGGLVFLLATAGAFYWLWSQSKNYNPSPPISDNLVPVQIESVKKDADDILNGLVNNSAIPIPAPIEKMGKANPFVDN